MPGAPHIRVFCECVGVAGGPRLRREQNAGCPSSVDRGKTSGAPGLALRALGLLTVGAEGVGSVPFAEPLDMC